MKHDCVFVALCYLCPGIHQVPAVFGVSSITGKVALCEVIKAEASVPALHISHLSCYQLDQQPAGKPPSPRRLTTRDVSVFSSYGLSTSESAAAHLILSYVRNLEFEVFPPDQVGPVLIISAVSAFLMESWVARSGNNSGSSVRKKRTRCFQNGLHFKIQSLSFSLSSFNCFCNVWLFKSGFMFIFYNLLHVRVLS